MIFVWASAAALCVRDFPLLGRTKQREDFDGGQSQFGRYLRRCCFCGLAFSSRRVIDRVTRSRNDSAFFLSLSLSPSADESFTFIFWRREGKKKKRIYWMVSDPSPSAVWPLARPNGTGFFFFPPSSVPLLIRCKCFLCLSSLYFRPQFLPPNSRWLPQKRKGIK